MATTAKIKATKSKGKRATAQTRKPPRSKIRAAVKEQIELLHTIPEMTVETYFRGCKLFSKERALVKRKPGRTVHQLILEGLRDEEMGWDFYRLCGVERSSMNHLDTLMNIYFAIRHP